MTSTEVDNTRDDVVECIVRSVQKNVRDFGPLHEQNSYQYLFDRVKEKYNKLNMKGYYLIFDFEEKVKIQNKIEIICFGITTDLSNNGQQIAHNPRDPGVTHSKLSKLIEFALETWISHTDFIKVECVECHGYVLRKEPIADYVCHTHSDAFKDFLSDLIFSAGENNILNL